MAPFETIGERARWELLYELFVDAEDEQIVTYETLGTAIDVDSSTSQGRQAVQMAVRRAGKELEKINKRAIRNVSGKGYLVVKPEAHLELATHHHKKAGRSLKRGHSKVTNVDLNRIQDPEVRNAFGAMVQVMGQQIDMNRRVSTKLRRHDWAITQLQQESQHTAAVVDSEVEDLRTRQSNMEHKLAQIAEKLGVASLETDTE